jgi:hypothetical protein
MHQRVLGVGYLYSPQSLADTLFHSSYRPTRSLRDMISLL